MCEHKTKAVRMLQARFMIECFCAECGITVSTLAKNDIYRDPDALENWARENNLNVELVRSLAT
jgi:hypothetical protein